MELKHDLQTKELMATPSPLTSYGSFAPGLVTIAGAGPGNAELLTIKAAQRIRQATVILCDALVPVEIRSLFPGDCLVLDTGTGT